MSEDKAQLIALVLRLIALVIFVVKVFPRVIHETRVGDGIRRLRLFIFHLVVFFFIMGALLTQMNYCNLIGCDLILDKNITTIIQATLFLSISIILYLIYHQKYYDKER